MNMFVMKVSVFVVLQKPPSFFVLDRSVFGDFPMQPRHGAASTCSALGSPAASVLLS